MIKLMYIIIGLPWRLSTKEYACNSLDTGLIPGWGRFPGAGHGNPLQYSCLEKPMTEEPGGYSPQGCKELDSTEATEHVHTYVIIMIL